MSKTKKVILQPEKDWHHMIPRSRLTKKQEKKYAEWIKKQKTKVLHEAWHALFYNMTPFEALICIIKNYSKGVIFEKVEVRACFDGDEHKYTINNKIGIDLFANSQLNIRHNTSYHALFTEKTPVSIISDIVESWSPADYFRAVHVIAKSKSGIERQLYIFGKND